MLGLLRDPRWVRGLALAVAVAVGCVLLGQWQWHRRQERLARNAPLVQNYDEAPAAVSTVLRPDGAPPAAGNAWTPVRVRGTYDPAATVLVRNRPQDEQTGYEVLVPLLLTDGTTLVVDRGWLPAGSSSDVPDTVPAPPPGPVEVVARVKGWEVAKRGEVPAGQVASIAAGAVATQVQRRGGSPRLLGGYAVLAGEDPAPAAAPAPLDRPEVDDGPHLAYTVQWYGFALTALVVWVVAGRRELEGRRTGDAGDTDGVDGADRTEVVAGPAVGAERAGSGALTTRRRPAAPRPRGRRRPPRPGSDEAAEDAEVEAAQRR